MGAKKSLTPGAKQQEILDYIKQFIIERGFPPSVREICNAVKLSSTSTVHSHLSALEEKGYIKRDGSKSRTIELVDDEFNSLRKEVVNVPVVGTVTAGMPILAVENLEGYFPIPLEYLPNTETFMLKVKGQSMINKGIFDGDQILVKQQDSAKNGDMVVALIDDSVTVKTFYKENDHIRLQPENDSMDPIIVDNCSILGVVIGLFRLY
ncbi:MAG: transcriptional repressor LexA [Lachnospiraceae bacterium]|nr:transcriptional repressor LexA [Lachnospiraceae bacterium]